MEKPEYMCGKHQQMHKMVQLSSRYPIILCSMDKHTGQAHLILIFIKISKGKYLIWVQSRDDGSLSQKETSTGKCLS